MTDGFYAYSSLAECEDGVALLYENESSGNFVGAELAGLDTGVAAGETSVRLGDTVYRVRVQAEEPVTPDPGTDPDPEPGVDPKPPVVTPPAATTARPKLPNSGDSSLLTPLSLVLASAACFGAAHMSRRNNDKDDK